MSIAQELPDFLYCKTCSVYSVTKAILPYQRVRYQCKMCQSFDRVDRGSPPDWVHDGSPGKAFRWVDYIEGL